MKPVIRAMCLSGILVYTMNASAASVQLWEQDVTSIGTYHAGRAALANDASTAYNNPAGIPRIKNQQIIFGDVGIFTDIKYSGTITVNTLPTLGAQPTTQQAGGFSQLPEFHYVAPITQNLGFGLSLAVPFGLQTDYGRTSPARYASTATRLQVVDLSPALGFNVTNQISLGLGLDVQRAAAEFGTTGALGVLGDTDSTTKGWSTAYGFHLGGLYQFLPTTRFGLTYNSSVRHQLRGTSKFVGPIANFFNFGMPIVSTNARANLTLPAYTTFSLFHQLNPRWGLMGTAIYTQWNSAFRQLTLQNVAGINALSLPSNTITATIPEFYRNTWDFSVGAEFYANPNVTLRSGIGYAQSPVMKAYRNLQIPDSNRFVIALGGHYQATKALGLDLGWSHLFLPDKAVVNPPPQAIGGQVVTTNGTVDASADVVGLQVVWDIA